MSEKKRVLLKLLVLGDSGVGKTALLHKYVNGTFIQEHKATIGADFISKDVEFEDKVVSLQIWDTAGQERFLSLGPAFYRGTDACLLVYDITNAQSFKQIETWRNSFLEEANLEDAEKFPFALCGSKCDLEQSRAISTQEGEKLANQFKMLFFETSALNGKNVNEAIQKIASVGGDSETVPSIQTDIVNKALKLDIEESDTKKPPTSAACSC